MDGGSKVENMVTDSQVVLQAEWLQHNSIPDRERQPELLVRVSWGRRKRGEVNKVTSCIVAVTRTSSVHVTFGV